MPEQYHFLPWTRQGLAAAIQTPDTLGDLNKRNRGFVSLEAQLSVNGVPLKSMQIRLMSPGDVTSIVQRQILKTSPRPSSLPYEPHLFASIDFDRPDFPWLFTPAAATKLPDETAARRLRPWLVLVVIPKEYCEITKEEGRSHLVLNILDGFSDPLPSLESSWLWAHTQSVPLPNADTGQRDLNAELQSNSEHVISRLLCPTVLDAEKDYVACLTPAFRSGRLAALGVRLNATDEQWLEPAWEGTKPPDPPTLPIFYHWEFRTGLAADFETLVRRLEGRELPQQVGRRPMRVQDDRVLKTTPVLGLEGALKTLDVETLNWVNENDREQFEANLTPLVNDRGTPDAPKVTLPLYGSPYANLDAIPAGGWMRELNVDPRLRAAAAFGTRVVREHQEDLFIALWAAAEEVEKANQILRQAQLARSLSQRIMAQDLGRLPPASFYLITEPAHTRIMVMEGVTQRSYQRNIACNLPLAAVSPAFRRLIRPRGPIMRRVRASRTGQPRSSIVDRLNVGGFPLRTPPRVPFNGMVGANTPEGTSFYHPDSQYWQSGTSTPTPTPTSTPTPTPTPTSTPTPTPTPTSTLTPTPTPWSPLTPTWTPTSIPLDFVTVTPFDVSTSEPTTGPVVVPRKHAGSSRRTKGLNAIEGCEIVPLDQMRIAIQEQLRPEQTIPARVNAQIRRGRANFPRAGGDPLEPMLLEPELTRPMYEPLRDISPDLLLPGLELVPSNTIALLIANAAFIEAYMVGVNQELGREALWRNFPTEIRVTFLRHFWDTSASSEAEAIRDIPKIHEWNRNQAMGSYYRAQRPVGSPCDESLILMIRGELLQRYPSANIYAVPAVVHGTVQEIVNGQEVTRALRKPQFDDPDAQRYPVFRATIAPDITFFGFGSEPTARQAHGDSRPDSVDPGWFFVIEQPALTDPQFGLDENQPFPLDAVDAARFASRTLQRAVRFSIHADDLLRGCPPA